MHEFLSSPNSEDVLATLGGLAFGLLLFITFLFVWLPLQWRLHRRAEMEAVLKKEMLDRGMSAEEIELVVTAPLGARWDHRLGPTPPT